MTASANITGPAVRDPRWRVSFNGLGSISYCATVRRTEYLRQAIRSDVLGRTREFITSLRYWDATHCVEFGYRMAEQALEFDLRHETEFLVRYDKILKAVNEKFDLRGSDLSTLVVCCLDNDGKLSKNRRRQFLGRVPERVFDYIEDVASEIIPPASAVADPGVDSGPDPH